MIYTITLNPAIDRELTIDRFAFDTVLRASRFRVDTGGKGFNVSRMLRALGAPSVALGFLGGHNGRLAAALLKDAGIDTDFVWIAGETRVNISIVESGEKRHLKVNEPGPEVSTDAQTQLMSRITELVQPGDHWVISGSLAPGIPASYLVRMIEAINARGGITNVDTSGMALELACGARAALIKPNLEELSTLTDAELEQPDTVLRAARLLREQQGGPISVLVSMGARGGLLDTPNGAWWANSIPIELANPIGAGDCMTAGFVWARSQGLSDPDALRWGIACGAAAASLPGTTVGSREQVDALAKRVTPVAC